MSTLTEAKQKVMEIIATYYSIDKSIPELADEAQSFIEQAERRRVLEDQIADLEGGIDPLAGELAALKDPFITALYEEDVAEQTRIRKEKKRLEAAIVGLQKEVEKLQKQLDDDPVDMPALVALRATLDGYEVPNAWDATRALTTPLQAVENDLTQRVADVRRSISGIDVDPDQVEAHRVQHDPAYRAQKASEERQDLKYQAEAERRGQRYRAVIASNTREAEIAGARAEDDRISASVGDSRLSDELDD